MQPLTKSAAILMVALATGCSRRATSDKTPADSSADMSGMPGMAAPSSVIMTAAQIRHGGIRWEPTQAGTASLQAAAVPLPGQVVPNEDRTARLGAPASGRVLTVRVSPGDRVRAGQTLVTLQSPEAGMAQSDLAKATAAVTSRKAQAAYAASARRRAERLLALKAIPRQDYERAIADDELAQSELAQAEAELERARSTAQSLGASGMRSGELGVRAPLAGVVLERTAVPGTVVEAGAPLVVVSDPATLWVTLNAPESALGSLRVGESFRFVVAAYPADTFTARLTAVGAGLEPDTRTVLARGVVANRQSRLKPAMLASVFLPLGGKPSGGTIRLPEDAVQVLDSATVVFVVTPSDTGGGARFTARHVEVGPRTGGRIMILRGLSAGELVVISGAFSVKAELKKAAIHKMEM